MPLFRATHKTEKAEARKLKARSGKRRCDVDDGDVGWVSPLSRLCLQSVAENMKQLWVKDYADNYLDQYHFRYIMGPFNQLPGELVEALTSLLCSKRELSRPALHLLLVPQLRGLSLGACPGLVTPNLCCLVAIRCQSLTSLDVSGAQQLSAQTQCDLLSRLHALRSLSLAGTPCDGRVVSTIARRCRALRHLDLTRCHRLAPADLLPLGGGGSSQTPPPLRSLLAADIGFGEEGEEEEEGGDAAAVAHLLLTLPGLERAVLRGLGEACALILGGGTEGSASGEGVSSLGELWRERAELGGGRREREEEEEEEEEGEELLWDRDEGESEDEGMREDEGTREEEGAAGGGVSSARTARANGGEGVERPGTGGVSVVLSLKEAGGVSAGSLPAVARLCPALRSVSLDCESERGRDQASLLAAGLRGWAGQLRNLTLRFPGPLDELLPSLRCAGASLHSLALEGVRTGPRTPLLELLHACPRLKTLLVDAEPPPGHAQDEEEEEEEEENARDGPCLPQLCSLSLHFSHDQRHAMPVMSWRALKGALWCLLSGSPMLERVSLVAVPCPLDPILNRVLTAAENLPVRNPPAAEGGLQGADDPCCPLARLRHLDLANSNVTGSTAKRVFVACKRMRSLDLSGCWHVKACDITHLQCAASRRRQCLTVTWK